jgi:hypothetical protein
MRHRARAMAADAGNVVASAAAKVRCQQRIRTQRRIAAERHVDQDDVAFRSRDDAKAQLDDRRPGSSSAKPFGQPVCRQNASIP